MMTTQHPSSPQRAAEPQEGTLGPVAQRRDTRDRHSRVLAFETSKLRYDDVAFTYGHALAWAMPSLDLNRAQAYATWYVERFTPGAIDLGDLPAHPNVWGFFLNWYAGSDES